MLQTTTYIFKGDCFFRSRSISYHNHKLFVRILSVKILKARPVVIEGEFFISVFMSVKNLTYRPLELCCEVVWGLVELLGFPCGLEFWTIHGCSMTCTNGNLSLGFRRRSLVIRSFAPEYLLKGKILKWRLWIKCKKTIWQLY